MATPLRLPIQNVFRSQTGGPSGIGVAGRIETGVVQVGDKLAVLPGDEQATIKSRSVCLCMQPQFHNLVPQIWKSITRESLGPWQVKASQPISQTLIPSTYRELRNVEQLSQPG